jgi:hypothetical protein
MVTLTPEQLRQFQEAGAESLRLRDPNSNQEYVLLPAQTYERLLSCLDELNPRDLYPALHRALKDEGWDNPQMDEYNRYG